jgi:RimJ/RimL family protein N-acetyltransferase
MSSPPPRAQIPTLSELPHVIETARLTLRPLAVTDVDDLWPHVSDPKVTPYISWNPHADKEETRTFLAGAAEAMAKGNDMVWAIVREGRASGCIGLHGIAFMRRAWRVDRAELGYWIGIPLWNQGYMTEAAGAVTKWGFETLGLHKITVGCLEPNVASRKLLEKLGYRFVGKLEDDVWRDGHWLAHLRYELLASEWADISRTLRFNRPPPPT